MTLADIGRVGFTLTVKSAKYAASKSLTFGVDIRDACEGAVFSIQPITKLDVQIPSEIGIQWSYDVTSTPSFCDFQPVSLLPTASYLTYNKSKIYIDPSKITYQDLGTKTFTLKVDSPTSSDTTPGEQTLEIEIDVFIDCTT